MPEWYYTFMQKAIPTVVMGIIIVLIILVLRSCLR